MYEKTKNFVKTIILPVFVFLWEADVSNIGRFFLLLYNLKVE